MTRYGLPRGAAISGAKPPAGAPLTLTSQPRDTAGRQA
jgi:hypothetical protein